MGGGYHYTDPNEKYYYALNDPQKRRFPHTPEGYKMAEEYEAQLEVEKFRKGATAGAATQGSPDEGGGEYKGGALPSLDTFKQKMAPGTTFGETESGKSAYADIVQKPEVRGALEEYSTRAEGLEPEDKEVFDMLVKAEDWDAAKKFVAYKKMTGGGGRGATAYLMEKATAEDVKKANDIVDAMEAGGASEEVVMKYRAMAEKNPLGFINKLAQQTISTEEGLRGKKAAVPIAEEQAGRTSAASTAAGIKTKSKLADVAAETDFKIKKAGKSGTTAGMERLSDKEVDGLTGLQEAVGTLEAALDTFDTDYVGVFKGRAGNLKEAIGAIGEDEAVFRSYAQRFQNALIKANSGAAVTENEMQRMVKETFDFKLSPQTYLAKMRSNLDFIKYKNDLKIKNLGATNRDTSGQTTFGVDIDLYSGKKDAGKKPGSEPTQPDTEEEEKKKQLRNKYGY